MARRGKPTGRYENVGSALHPGGGFLPEGSRLSGRIEIAHARVVDPIPTLDVHLRVGKFQKAMVNLAHDPLEREHRYGRIDRQQYAAGRRYRETLAWAQGRGDCPDGPRGRAIDAHEYRIAKAIDAAKEAVEMRREAVLLCGPRREMILSAVLGDEISFTDTANRIGSEPGAPRFWRAKAGVTRVAREFREALRQLSDQWFRATAV